MAHKATALCFFASVLLAAGCAATQRGERSARQSNEITSEEIAEAVSYSNAYQVVQRLRPQWLRRRGRSNINYEIGVKVYVEGARFGIARSLSQISASNVARMTYLRPSEASDRFGLNHDQGAILVSLKGG